GELMGTQIGARFLRSRGLEVAWADARTLLRAEERRSASAKATVLSATCGFAPDSALERRLASLAPAIVTQGFIASDAEGHTVLPAESSIGGAQLKAVCSKKGITLISMESPGMWHQVGFLADAFRVFKDHGLSVDLVSTSETNVTVSLDPAANTLDNAQVAALAADLSRLCRVQVIGPCASVSLVGRNIRAILHQLGGAFEFFEEQKIHLVSQAANDLNFTFVVDEDQGDRLVEQLHELLIRPVPGDKVLGPTWQQLFSQPRDPAGGSVPWWRSKRTQLLEALGEHEAAFVYDLEAVR